jgi:hypothetical protein
MKKSLICISDWECIATAQGGRQRQRSDASTRPDLAGTLGVDLGN